MYVFFRESVSYPPVVELPEGERKRILVRQALTVHAYMYITHLDRYL